MCWECARATSSRRTLYNMNIPVIEKLKYMYIDNCKRKLSESVISGHLLTEFSTYANIINSEMKGYILGVEVMT